MHHVKYLEKSLPGLKQALRDAWHVSGLSLYTPGNTELPIESLGTRGSRL